ncbi:MAG: formyltransferase family protein [Gemmatimonadaceae bacterium]
MTEGGARPRVVVIAHGDAPLHLEALPRWVQTWGDLAGIVCIHESRTSLWKRLRREKNRVGLLRLADVIAFRLYYRLTRARRDAAWMAQLHKTLDATLPPLPDDVPFCETRSPNAAQAEAFIARCAPDVMLALCKHILAQRVFSIAKTGTFVLHPGICPEYRNAHGCFWALAHGDLERVGLTLLRINRGVDTGPVFGYYTAPYDEREESHVVIQHRVLFDNLTSIAARLLEIWRGTAQPLSTAGRRSAEYGQPWLTAWWRWKHAASRRDATAATPTAGRAQ